MIMWLTKRIAVICFCIAGLLLTSCGKTNSKTIVVLKFATHPALDEVEQSFVSAFQQQQSGQKNPVLVERLNADGNRQRAKEFAENISVRPNVALIVTLGTAAGQAVVNTSSKIPILYGAVSDPQGAGLLATGRATGIANVSPDIVKQAIFVIKQINPDWKKIGTIYNPGEQNSVFVQQMIMNECKLQGYELIARRITDVTQISTTSEDLVGQVDVLYCANDNTINLGISSLASIALATKRLLVLGELNAISKGPAIAVGVNYTDTGRDLAKMANDILSAADVSKVLPRPAPAAEVWLNQRVLSEIGVNPPDSVKSTAKLIK